MLLATLATAGSLAQLLATPTIASESGPFRMNAPQEADPIGAPGDIAFAVIKGYAPIATSMLWSPFANDSIGPLARGIEGLRDAMRGHDATAAEISPATPSRADSLRVDRLQRAPVPTPHATKTGPIRLNTEQRRVAGHIAKTYRVAETSIEPIVYHAYKVGAEFRLEPSLLLAVMAVESSFNPMAESKAGAQGLMQVLTRVHKERYAAFGGVDAAWDPLINIRVGAGILSEYVQRHGDLAGGLKAYVGAALLDHDFGYGSKVISRRDAFAAVARGAKSDQRTVAGRSSRPSATARNSYDDSRPVTASVGL